MASIPIVATQVRPPEDPSEQLLKATQIKSMLFGQQLSAAELQGKNLNNQALALQIEGQQRLRAAQNDPAWDPTDTDSATSLLRHYGVPLEVSGRVISAIGQIRQGLQQQSSENISNVKAAHDFLDDQLQSVKSAPLDSKQSAYESAIANVRNFTNLLPDGAAKKQFLAEIGNVPPMFDAHWVNQQHSQLRTMSQLNEEALKIAQAREAGGKGAQAEAAAALDTGKITPGSPAFAPTPQALALGASQGTSWAAPIQTGEAQQAGRVKMAEGQVTPLEEYKQSQENYRATLSRQATFANTMQKDGLDRLGQMFADPQHGYVQFLSQAQATKNSIASAKNGDQLASSLVPLMTALGVTSFAGVHRINQTEVNAAGPEVGSAFRRTNAILDKIGSGKVPEATLNEMNSLVDGLIDAKHGAVVQGARMVSANSGLDPARTMVMNRAGQMDTLQNVIGASGGGTVTMKAPNGQTKEVPADQVDHYKKMGATVVESSGQPAPATTTGSRP